MAILKKTIGNKINFLLLLAGLLLQACSFAQQDLATANAAREFYEKMAGNPEFATNARGENFCWHAAVNMDVFIDNFQLTRNTAWLDAASQYYDFLLGKRDTDPDGYKGWIGPYQYDSKYWQDALVGDAILLAQILQFCIIVKETDSLSSRYKDKAESYVETAKKDFVEKWDKRGCWYDDKPYGSYIGFNKFLDSANLKQWITDPEVSRAGISHPFNKQMDAAEVCMRLYRLTGDILYRDRAQAIFFTAKSHFQYFDDHYCWNYFDPLTPGDIDLEKKTSRHFVDVHPWRSGYQASEVDKIAEAYHYGIVFDEKDIQRIINTNLKVMWNKDKVTPRFINSNGLGADHDTSGIAGFQAAFGHSSVTKNAGELWTGLLDFDQTIRDLYGLRFKDKTSPEYIQYKNSQLASPPQFKRKYSREKPVIPAVQFTESKDLNLAVVLPHNISAEEKSIIVSRSRRGGPMQIDLYSEKGKKLTNLFSGKVGDDIFMITWDGKDPKRKAEYKGKYTIRWTTSYGFREFPVVIL